MRPEERLAELLCQKGLTIAVAESCTGGLLASRITDVPGASRYFLGGIIAYNNEVKTRLLRVQEAMLNEVGAVSAQTAEAMAQGCKALFRSNLAISTTGIAGPGGGSEKKPVGLVFIALKTPVSLFSHRFLWLGDRVKNRRDSVDAALKMAIDWLSSGVVTE
jgi:PncC family amidohydrolase